MLALVLACFVPGLAALPCKAGPFEISQACLAKAGWPLDMDLAIKELIYLDEVLEVSAVLEPRLVQSQVRLQASIFDEWLQGFDGSLRVCHCYCLVCFVPVQHFDVQAFWPPQVLASV